MRAPLGRYISWRGCCSPRAICKQQLLCLLLTVSLLCVFVTFLVSVRCVHSSISISLDALLSISHLFFSGSAARAAGPVKETPRGGVPSLAPRRAVAAPLRLANAPPQCEIFSEAPAAGPTPAFRPAQISALALEIDRFVLAHRYRWRGPRMIKGPTKRQRIQAGSYPGRLSGSSMPYRYRIACKTSSRLHPNGGELVPPLAGSLRRR